MPVPRLTVKLRKSLKDKVVGSLGIVYTDHNEAPYDTLVHHGSVKGRRPRRYLGDAVVRMKIPIYKEWIKMFRQAIQTWGRS
jgi:hypothetical protein